MPSTMAAAVAAPPLPPVAVAGADAAADEAKRRHLASQALDAKSSILSIETDLASAVANKIEMLDLCLTVAARLIHNTQDRTGDGGACPVRLLADVGAADGSMSPILAERLRCKELRAFDVVAPEGWCAGVMSCAGHRCLVCRTSCWRITQR